jgi:hypothetical protein
MNQYGIVVDYITDRRDGVWSGSGRSSGRKGWKCE